MYFKFFLALIIIFSYTFLYVFSQAEIVARIEIEGNQRVSDATIISKIKTRPTQVYNENVINEDIKALYATGFFESVSVEKKTVAEGIVVIFKVNEKPLLKKITIEGARAIRKDKILQSLDIKENYFIDDYKLKDAVSKIKDLYNKKGFSQTKVFYEKLTLEKNELEVKFVIEESGILRVREINIEGNKKIPTSKIIKLIKTKKAWLFNRGVFKEDVFSDDIKKIITFYKSKGFNDVNVETKIEEKPKGLYITININEGRCYYLGEIKIEGNRDISMEEIKKVTKLKSGDVFSDEAIYDEISKIREIYVDKGYIFSEITPLKYLNPKTQKIDLTYKIKENQMAYVERIDIRGNIYTKDKVIRRQLRIYPQEKFDGEKIRKSKERLENLGYFEEIRIETEPGSSPDRVNLVFDVKEAKTGYFSFGGGYSSIEEFIGYIEIRKRNFDYQNWSTFTGAGQDISLYASVGSLSNQYQLSFTNPWIFDYPVSFGFDAYKKGHRKDEDVGYGYREDVTGGDIRLGKEFSDYFKGEVSYRFDNIKIRDVVNEATQELKDEEGSTNLTSGEFSLSYDTRDNVFSPLKGIYFLNTFQLTASFLGGEKDFIKNFSRLSLYFPLINRSVVELRLRTGFGDPFSDTKKIPIYERFFAGGAYTIRGYGERKIGPIDEKTKDPIGGEAMFVGNLEYTYPLFDFLKVATFFDTGEVWKKNSDFFKGGLKSSFGVGIRVKTPIGPINLDYGWPLDKEPGEEKKKSGKFHFSISKGF